MSHPDCRRCEDVGWLYQNKARTMAEDKGQFRRIYCNCTAAEALTGQHLRRK